MLFQIRFLPVSPPLIVFLTKSPLVKDYDLSSVKALQSGAAPLGQLTEKQAMKLLKLDYVKQGNVTIKGEYTLKGIT